MIVTLEYTEFKPYAWSTRGRALSHGQAVRHPNLNFAKKPRIELQYYARQWTLWARPRSLSHTDTESTSCPPRRDPASLDVVGWWRRHRENPQTTRYYFVSIGALVPAIGLRVVKRWFKCWMLICRAVFVDSNVSVSTSVPSALPQTAAGRRRLSAVVHWFSGTRQVHYAVHSQRRSTIDCNEEPLKFFAFEYQT